VSESQGIRNASILLTDALGADTHACIRIHARAVLTLYMHTLHASARGTHTLHAHFTCIRARYSHFTCTVYMHPRAVLTLYMHTLHASARGTHTCIHSPVQRPLICICICICICMKIYLHLSRVQRSHVRRRPMGAGRAAVGDGRG